MTTVRLLLREPKLETAPPSSSCSHRRRWARRRRPGLFVVESRGSMIGFVTLDRRDADRLGHIRPGGGEAELVYMFVPQAWAGVRH